MDLANYIKLGISCLTFLAMVFVLYLNWKMIKFSGQYNKRWAWAWKVFFITMCIILLRRGIGIVWGFGIDCGEFAYVLSWIDYVGVATACSILYVIFLYVIIDTVFSVDGMSILRRKRRSDVSRFSGPI